jgi:hypothetical protein
MEDTEAAADFVLGSPPETVLNALGVYSIDNLPDFELLLQTSAVGGTPNSAQVIAYRIHSNLAETNSSKLSLSR